MDANTFLTAYAVLIDVAFAVSVINWVGYSVLAPWYKSVTGRIIWLKFLANMLVLSVPFISINIPSFPYRRELFIVFMALFVIAIITAGIGVYTVQIKGYLNKKISKHNLKKERNNAHSA